MQRIPAEDFAFYNKVKEKCHEDFADLGKFCAKIITLRRFYLFKKCFCKATTKISNEFYQRELTIINFFRIFGTRSIKTRINWPIFFKFQSISIHAIRSDRKQFQYLPIVFNNKTRSIVLEFNWCEDTFQLFIKLPNSMTMPL